MSQISELSAMNNKSVSVCVCVKVFINSVWLCRLTGSSVSDKHDSTYFYVYALDVILLFNMDVWSFNIQQCCSRLLLLQSRLLAKTHIDAPSF